MKKTIIYLLGLTLAVFLLSCGSGGGGSASSGTSLVTIAIGDVSATGSGIVTSQGFSSAIPAGVETLEIIISFGQGKIVDEVHNVAGQAGFAITYDLPNGENLFEVIARDSNGITNYFGKTIKSINGATLVQVFMNAILCNSYSVQEVPFQWDGAPHPELSDYGDDESHLYSMPWSLTFYGQSFTEVTQDSNGNIWFEYNNDAYAFDLPTGGGHGRVISVWNDHLKSYYYGDGYEVQHKSSPERVVFRWDTETYSDDDDDYVNEFEAVLFPDGSIRFDYRSFECYYCDDSGSGISSGDGVNYISLTDLYGYVYNLEGRSFLFTCETAPVAN
jgi:hypothetical protein